MSEATVERAIAEANAAGQRSGAKGALGVLNRSLASMYPLSTADRARLGLARAGWLVGGRRSREALVEASKVRELINRSGDGWTAAEIVRVYQIIVSAQRSLGRLSAAQATASEVCQRGSPSGDADAVQLYAYGALAIGEILRDRGLVGDSTAHLAALVDELESSSGIDQGEPGHRPEYAVLAGVELARSLLAQGRFDDAAALVGPVLPTFKALSSLTVHDHLLPAVLDIGHEASVLERGEIAIQFLSHAGDMLGDRRDDATRLKRCEILNDLGVELGVAGRYEAALAVSEGCWHAYRDDAERSVRLIAAWAACQSAHMMVVLGHGQPARDRVGEMLALLEMPRVRTPNSTWTSTPGMGRRRRSPPAVPPVSLASVRARAGVIQAWIQRGDGRPDDAVGAALDVVQTFGASADPGVLGAVLLALDVLVSEFVTRRDLDEVDRAAEKVIQIIETYPAGPDARLLHSGTQAVQRVAALAPDVACDIASALMDRLDDFTDHGPALARAYLCIFKTLGARDLDRSFELSGKLVSLGAPALPILDLLESELISPDVQPDLRVYFDGARVLIHARLGNLTADDSSCMESRTGSATIRGFRT